MGQIAIDRIMRRGLIGQRIRLDSPLEQRTEYIGNVAEQRHRQRFAAPLRCLEHAQRLVQGARLRIDVAGLEAFGDAAWTALDGQQIGAGHGRGQRLRAAHAAQARGENPFAGKVCAKMTPAHFSKRFIRALNDSLAADVDPGASRHLPEHRQPLAIELVEMFPGCPMRHEIGVGNEHARRVGMGGEHADRFAGLHQQGFLFGEGFQGLDDAVVAVPIACGAPDAAVHHQLGGILRDFGVQVIHQHAQRRLGHPATRAQGIAARRADDSGLGWGEHASSSRGESAPTIRIGFRDSTGVPRRRFGRQSKFF